MVPYADFNLLKFPDRDQAMEKITDLTLLSDIFPTGYHGAVTAGVGRARPSTSPAPARSAWPPRRPRQLLGAAVVIVGDLIEERLAQAQSFGCETVDVSKGDPQDQIEQILGVPEVDCAVDCVGFEARGHGDDASHEAPGHRAQLDHGPHRAPAARSASPACTSPATRAASTTPPRSARSSIRLGLGWAKSLPSPPASAR